MEGNITHTAITSYSYGTLRLKKGPTLPGPIFPTLHIFSYNFLLNNYSLRDPIYMRPPNFLLSQPTFATHFRDSHSRPHFATPFAIHIRETLSRLLSCDSRSRLHSRLPFTTRVRDHTHDSRSRLPIVPPNVPPTATRYFLSRLLLCDSTTDGRTVLTPQHHHPSVPTLTLL